MIIAMALIVAFMTMVNGFVDVFVINLKHRLDRLIYMQGQLDNLGIKWKRFDAILFSGGGGGEEGYQLPLLHKKTKMEIIPIREFLDKTSFTFLNWGSLGCWQSHLQLMLSIMDKDITSNDGPFLILEDDVEIDASMINFLSSSFLEKLPPDWMVLFFDWQTPIIKESINGFHLLSSCTRASAYMVRNRDCLNKLIDSSNTKEMQIADVHWNDDFESGNIIAYAMDERIIRHNFDYGSNIMKINNL